MKNKKIQTSKKNVYSLHVSEEVSQEKPQDSNFLIENWKPICIVIALILLGYLIN